jgi:hypothetical protein
MQKTPKRGYWIIRYRSIEYKIEKISKSVCVSIWYDDSWNSKSKPTRDRKLKQLVNMWHDNQVDMPPGEFITRVMGTKCYDIP